MTKKKLIYIRLTQEEHHFLIRLVGITDLSQSKIVDLILQAMHDNQLVVVNDLDDFIKQSQQLKQIARNKVIQSRISPSPNKMSLGVANHMKLCQSTLIYYILKYINENRIIKAPDVAKIFYKNNNR